jgi:hypothetical protein
MAYTGLATVSAFIVFGLTDCMFTQKMQTSFFSLSVALLYGQIGQRERFGVNLP